MAKKSLSAPSHPLIKHIPAPPPRENVLRDLPSILFHRILERYGYNGEPEVLDDFPWRAVSIYRHPFVCELSRDYSVHLRELKIISNHALVWIGCAEGYLSDSTCLFICERSANLENMRASLKPILIIEAGYRIPIQEGPADFLTEECSTYKKIRQPLIRSMKPQRIIELQREVLIEYERIAATLPRNSPRKNPLFE